MQKDQDNYQSELLILNQDAEQILEKGLKMRAFSEKASKLRAPGKGVVQEGVSSL